MTPTDDARLDRRSVLRQGAALAAAALAGGGAAARAGGREEAGRAVEAAHAELWRRFVDRHGIIGDYAGLDGSVPIPTPEECRQGKPNALGWWSPIENGAMFNGFYMDAAVNRWRHTRAPEDAAKARRLMEGLMLLASVSDVPGFVARGVSTDGRSHYPMGSNDQTLPWFLGLWRYLESGLATGEERRRVVAKVVATADAVVRHRWRMPAEPPFGARGSFEGFTFESAPRLLFVTRLLHRLTGDPAWDARHREARAARGGPDGLSRLALCERGMVFEHGGRHSWTSSGSVASVRALWETEDDAAPRAAYARGLEASARLAAESLPLAAQYDNDRPARFDPDWRKLNAWWKPQATEREAQDLAQVQVREWAGKVSPRFARESSHVREPAFAAWVVTLAPDADALAARAAGVERVLAHYAYGRLHYSQFFPVESAWWRLVGAVPAR